MLRQPPGPLEPHAFGERLDLNIRLDPELFLKARRETIEHFQRGGPITADGEASHRRSRR